MAWVVYCTLYKFSVFYDPSQYLHTSPESCGPALVRQWQRVCSTSL